RPDFGMLEADALQRVVQLDVDAEIIRIELQLVAGPDAGVLVDVDRQRGDRAVEGQLQVTVLRRVGLVVDPGGFAHAALLEMRGNRTGRRPTNMKYIAELIRVNA